MTKDSCGHSWESHLGLSPHLAHVSREKEVAVCKLVPQFSPPPAFLQNTLQRLGGPLEKVLLIEQSPIFGILKGTREQRLSH